MGLIGFVLGLFFGWLLHRERVGNAAYAEETQGGDGESASLADASARSEPTHQEVVDLRSQLTDAQHLLDERAATIAQLEAELTAYRDGSSEVASAEPAEHEFVDAAADEATAPDLTAVVDDFDEEEDVTDEVLTPSQPAVIVDQTVAAEEEPAPAVAGDAGEVVAADEPGAVDAVVTAEEPVVSAEDIAPAEEPEPEVAAEPVVDEPVVGEVPAEPVVDEPVVAEGLAEEVVTAVEEPTAAAPETVPADAGEGPFVPPPGAEPDNLRRIRGIGPAMERLLNEQGIVTFRQLAVLDEAGIDELQTRLPGVPGRIRRDRWVEQAQKLHVETHGDPV
jgi:predicted flap endonuclease-1-like 5' DNA nuclease